MIDLKGCSIGVARFLYAYFKTTDTTYSSVIFFQGVIKINNEFNEQNILNFLQSQGIINLDDVRENMKENERQKLLSMHKYKVFFDEKDNRWKTTVPDETKKNGRRLIAKRNKEQLDADLIAYYAQIEEKKHLDNNLYTLEKIFPLWLKYKAAQTDATSYSKRILVDWNKFYKDTSIVKKILCDLTYLELNEWAHNIVKKFNLNKKQYYNMSIIMRQCLDYACELDVLKTNHFNRVKIKKNLFTPKLKPDNNSQIFLLEEQKKICEEALKKFEIRDWCTTPLVIILNFHLGLRIGELVALKWSDIEGDYLHIQRMEQSNYELNDNNGIVSTKQNGYIIASHTKSSAGDRKVYLNSYAKEILKTIQKTNIKYGYFDNDFIFIKSRYKVRGTSRTLTKYLEDLCLSSGITNKSNHKIRKTMISSMFDSGININTIKEQAGHEDERTSLHNYCFDQNDDEIKKQLLEASANKIMVI